MNTPTLIVIFALIFLALFTIGIFIFIVLSRIIRQKRERRIEEVSDRMQTEILDAMSADDDGLARGVARRYAAYPKALTGVLVEYMRTITGPERERLNLIYDLALKARLARDLMSRFTYIRLRAIRPFVMFAQEDDFDTIIGLTRDRPAVRLAVIDALSSVTRPFVIPRLFQAFAESGDVELQAYMNVMYSLGDKIEEQLGLHLAPRLPVPKLGILIELVGHLPLPRLFRHILAFADHSEVEIRIRAARCLGLLNIPVKEVKEALLNMTEDQAWEVQAQALKSLGKLRIETAQATLKNALFSPHWHCRRNAGFALANLGERGIGQLEKTAAQSQDTYASEMARMVLEEITYFQTE